jgi:hypothetical protein
MAEYMTIELGGKTFKARLCTEEAPETVAAFKKHGRFESFVFAANICSNEITWNTPVDDIDFLENKVFYEDPGNVVYYPSWGAICVFFGPTEPAGWCTKFAEIVDEDKEAFAEEADKVWYGQGGKVVTDFLVEPEPEEEAEPANEAEAFIAEVKAATQDMWMDKPADVLRLIGRNFETGKEFACWAYCWGYLSNLGDALNLLYTFAENEEGDLATMEHNMAERCRGYAGSVVAAGHMTDLAALLERAADIAPTIGDYATFAKFARALELYVVQLSFWVDIELPWAEVAKDFDAVCHERYEKAGVNEDGHIILEEK